MVPAHRTRNGIRRPRICRDRELLAAKTCGPHCYTGKSAMTTKVPITVAHGDGIGPEIMDATLSILKEAGAAIEIETIEIGEKVYLRGNSAGIDPSACESLRRTKVFLKAPITTPHGGGFKSVNATARKRLGVYSNLTP